MNKIDIIREIIEMDEDLLEGCIFIGKNGVCGLHYYIGEKEDGSIVSMLPFKKSDEITEFFINNIHK